MKGSFDKWKVLKKVDINGTTNRLLRVIKTKNKIYFYENDNLFLTCDINDGNLRGRIGLYNVHASVYFKNLIIKKGDQI